MLTLVCGINMSLRCRTAIFGLVALICFSSSDYASAQGLRLEDPAVYEQIPERPRPRSELLLKKVDLSSMMPTPASQGNQGSCSGWAIAYATRSYYSAAENGTKPRSPSEILSPAFQYNSTYWKPNNIGQNCMEAGASLYSGMQHLKTVGALPMSERPYNQNVCNVENTSTMSTDEIILSSRYRIPDFKSNSDNSIIAIRQSLGAGHPVVVGVKTPSDWQGNFKQTVGSVYTYNNSTGFTDGGHAMVAVGYDNELQAIKLMNSWGPSWGNNGFVWLSNKSYEEMRLTYRSHDGTKSLPIYSVSELKPAIDPNRELIQDKQDAISDKPSWMAAYTFASKTAESFQNLEIDFSTIEENKVVVAGRGCTESVEEYTSLLREYSEDYLFRMKSDPWPVCQVDEYFNNFTNDTTIEVHVLSKSVSEFGDTKQVRSIEVEYIDGEKIEEEDDFFELEPEIDSDKTPVFYDGEQVAVDVVAPNAHKFLQLYYVSAHSGAKMIYSGKLPSSGANESKRLSLGKVESNNLTKIKRLTLTGPNYGHEAFVAVTGPAPFLDENLFQRNTENHGFLEALSSQHFDRDSIKDQFSYAAFPLTLVEKHVDTKSTRQWLITEDEYRSLVTNNSVDANKLPNIRSIEILGDKDGPKIEIVSPDVEGKVIGDNVVLEARFIPQEGRKVIADTLKVKYKTPISWFNVTKRVKEQAVVYNSEGIKSAPLSLPKGKHRLKVSLEDDEGSLGKIEIRLEVDGE